MKILSTIMPVKPLNKFNLKINPQKVFNENLNVVEKPIIANLKSYYRTAEEKLNDIYLERITNKLPAQTAKYNLEQFENLPDAIKKAIKPSDISRTGHIDQSKINSLWEAAKNAHKPGVYGYAPRFSGRPEEGVLDTLYTDNIPDIDINSSLDSMSDLTKLSSDSIDGIDTLSDTTLDIDGPDSLLDKIIDFLFD